MQFYKGFQNRKESQTYISEIGHLKSFSEALKEEPKIQWKNLRNYYRWVLFVLKINTKKPFLNSS